jgi:hypothetical protein
MYTWHIFEIFPAMVNISLYTSKNIIRVCSVLSLVRSSLQQYIICWILGSHSCDYGQNCLLGCDTV